jgi:uncharacterized protein
MTEAHIRRISSELNLQPRQVLATASLLKEGGTVPFIARYRKEATESLDEVAIANIRDRLLQLEELDARRASILESLAERNLLTAELKKAVEGADSMTRLEDVYQPYRPKRRTRAMIAKEAGLEPLAEKIWAQDPAFAPESEASSFLSAEAGLDSAEKVLAGARDILAERISDDATARERMREFYRARSVIRSKVMTGKETEGAKFKDYFEWSESLAHSPSHRVLAMRRGEKEGILIVRIEPPADEAIGILERLFVKGDHSSGKQVKWAVADAFERLLGPSMEGEMRLESKKRADDEAIRVFADNLRELLLAPALGRKAVLAIDPGFRTGCKVTCLDPQGKLLHNGVIYPDRSEREQKDAIGVIKALCQHFKIEAIAIGNGTGGRETEAFVRGIGLPSNITIVMVNESGASIYSASEAAREEFPDHDITVRGSVSIGRRLMDPLAELVKIDPKSIGVGQYQHDVDQSALKRSLDDVVTSCVNAVGVEVNTASKQLLTYVSGLGPALAENIVSFRNINGPFKNRRELLQVPRLGSKAFEQAAGFLRIRDGENPLERSAVHPESYPIVDSMARDLKCKPFDLIKDAHLRAKLKLEAYVNDKVGLPTLRDILQELAKPGRDPRQQFEVFSFAEGISKIEDLKPGMKVPGIITNVTAFGAFVDIGVHQDGLVHISQLSDQFVKNPADVVKVQDRVQVTVLEVDAPRKRISLSMKSKPEINVSSPGSHAAPSNGGPRDRDRRPSAPPSAAPKSLQGDWFSQALEKSKKR